MLLHLHRRRHIDDRFARLEPGGARVHEPGVAGTTVGEDATHDVALADPPVAALALRRDLRILASLRALEAQLGELSPVVAQLDGALDAQFERPALLLGFRLVLVLQVADGGAEDEQPVLVLRLVRLHAQLLEDPGDLVEGVPAARPAEEELRRHENLQDLGVVLLDALVLGRGHDRGLHDRDALLEVLGIGALAAVDLLPLPVLRVAGLDQEADALRALVIVRRPHLGLVAAQLVAVLRLELLVVGVRAAGLVADHAIDPVDLVGGGLAVDPGERQLAGGDPGADRVRYGRSGRIGALLFPAGLGLQVPPRIRLSLLGRLLRVLRAPLIAGVHPAHFVAGERFLVHQRAVLSVDAQQQAGFAVLGHRAHPQADGEQLLDGHEMLVDFLDPDARRPIGDQLRGPLPDHERRRELAQLRVLLRVGEQRKLAIDPGVDGAVRADVRHAIPVDIPGLR